MFRADLIMKNFSKYTDDELVLLLTESGVEVFKELYNRFWLKLFNAAHKRIKDTEICKEIVQEVFAKLWVNRAALVLTAGVGSYLYTAVRYNVIDYYRKHAVRADFIAVKHNRTELDNSTEDLIFLNDLKKHIDMMIELLPSKCRSVYRLSRIEFKTNREIASQLNISEKTVEGHLTKALYNLRLSISNLLSVLFFL